MGKKTYSLFSLHKARFKEYMNRRGKFFNKLGRFSRKLRLYVIEIGGLAVLPKTRRKRNYKRNHKSNYKRNYKSNYSTSRLPKSPRARKLKITRNFFKNKVGWLRTLLKF